MDYFKSNPEDRKFNTQQEKNRSVRDAKQDYFEASEAYSDCCWECGVDNSCNHQECIAAKATTRAAFDTFIEVVNTPVM